MMVTQNDTCASRSGKCRHSQNESKLRSHNITEPKSFDSKIYEDRNPAELWTCKVDVTELYWCKTNPNLDLATIVTITEENWKQTNGKKVKRHLLKKLTSEKNPTWALFHLPQSSLNRPLSHWPEIKEKRTGKWIFIFSHYFLSNPMLCKEKPLAIGCIWKHFTLTCSLLARKGHIFLHNFWPNDICFVYLRLNIIKQIFALNDLLFLILYIKIVLVSSRVHTKNCNH